MSAIFTYLVVGAIMAVTASAQVLKPDLPLPNGTYICFNKTVTVEFDRIQDNKLNYSSVSVEGEANTPGCYQDMDMDGKFTLYIKDLGTCNIIPDTDGIANFQVRIQYIKDFDTHQDAITNITCNVSATEYTKTVTQTYGVNGTIAVVPGRKGPLPIVELMALAEMYGPGVTSVVLGARFWLCVEIDYSLSLFKGALVDDLYTKSPAGSNLYLIKNRCKGDDIPHAEVGFPTTNGTTLSIYIELKAFRFYLKLEVKFEVKVTFFKHQKMQDKNACVSRKRRSADDEGTVSRVFTMTIPVTSSNDGKIITKEEVNVVDKTQKNNNNDKNAICEGHISATIFYAVVAVLAILLLLMIGVTVFFAARNRSIHVVREGKDNAAF